MIPPLTMHENYYLCTRYYQFILLKNGLLKNTISVLRS
jgi:hypothetical protein